MSRLKLGRMLVIDLEGTCWKEATREFQALNTEIIEIGITEVNFETRIIGKSKSYFVKPIKTTVTEYCTELTKITPEMLMDAPDLMRVSKMIRKDFNSLNVPWGAWGEDNRLVISECAKKGAMMPFSDTYYNLQLLHSLINGLNKPVAMTKLIDQLGMTLEGQLHRAGPDSFNTAKIVLKMFPPTI